MNKLIYYGCFRAQSGAFQEEPRLCGAYVEEVLSTRRSGEVQV